MRPRAGYSFLIVMVRIAIAGLKPGLHEDTLTPSPEDLGLDGDAFRDIEVQAHLDVQERRILVSLDVSGVATLECDRTLVDFEQPVAGQYAVLFATADLAEQLATDDQEIRVFDPSAPWLDVTEPVRDTLLLSLPTRRIAPGAEAEDIRTVYGPEGEDEAPIDPRWEALRALKDKK